MSSKPTYPLVDVCRLAASTTLPRIVTVTAQKSARADFGFNIDDVLRVVAQLTAADFYKTMASEQNPGLFQDVYKPTIKTASFPTGVCVYCKVQFDPAGRLVVISFKLST